MRGSPRLPDIVRDGARSPLSAAIGRYPGPVWSLGLWFIVGTILLVFTILTAQGSPIGFALRVVLIAYAFAVLAVLAVLAGRTPLWFLRLQILVSIAALTSLLLVARTDLGAATILWGYLGVSVYTAFWESRRWLVVVLGLVAVTSLAGVIEFGATGLILTQWLIAMFACALLSLILNVMLRRIERDALIDPLTGLLNRRGMQAVLDAMVKHGHFAVPQTVAVVDLDGFKNVNDTHGHEEGDRVLAVIGDALRTGLRPDDIAIRSGGDEFLLILPGADIEGARVAVTRVLAVAPLAWSAGYASWIGDRGFDAAVAEADEAMYAVKRRREHP